MAVSSKGNSRTIIQTGGLTGASAPRPSGGMDGAQRPSAGKYGNARTRLANSAFTGQAPVKVTAYNRLDGGIEENP